jgi:aryl-alcohol dehydrogenase-like predicted oxidoreductase
VRKRPLGKTGLVVSELALGTWALAGESYGAVDPKDAETVVARALDIGFTLFDTSDAYGAGKMEALLGKALRGKEVTVVTKGGTDRTMAPPRKRFDAEYIRASVGRSCKRLGRERLDVYLLHNPSPDALLSGEATGALEAMKKEGLVGHWGVSAGDPDVARAAIQQGAEVLELAYNLFQAIDLHRLAGEIMVAGTGVLACSTLAYGLLAGMWTGDREFPEADHRAQRWTKLELARRVEQLEAVRYLVRSDVLTMRGAAVRFALANHLVTAAVLGPKSVAQLEQLVRETGSGPTYLSDEALAALPRALSRVGIPT